MTRISRRAAAVLLLATTTLATAQAPAPAGKAIRLICPFPPAGAVDIASRAIAAELSKVLGQTVTVENRPGAGGNIGGAEAARAAPDGLTLFMTTSGINAINPVLYAKMPFDPIKDLVPVSALVSLSNVLVVHPSVKANSVADVIALAKADPGKMNYASSGSGTSIHMSGEMFKHMAKVDIQHIPYKGSGPAMTDLLGGQVMMMFDNIPSALPHIKSGKLRALAVTSAKRASALPDVPTVAESGVPGYEAASWAGIVVPKATPAPVVDALYKAFDKALKAPEVSSRLSSQLYEPVGMGPKEFARFAAAENEKWGKLIKQLNVKLD
mgnify:CR=1 FL=1